MTPELDARRRRLLFRARHRGTKEADLMIGGFVARNLATLTEPELDDLEAVLDHPDVLLSDWLTGRVPVPEDARTPMLDRLTRECSESGAGVPDEARRP